MNDPIQNELPRSQPGKPDPKADLPLNPFAIGKDAGIPKVEVDVNLRQPDGRDAATSDKRQVSGTTEGSARIERNRIPLKDKIAGALGNMIKKSQRDYMVGGDDFEETGFMSQEYQAQPRSWWRRMFSKLIPWSVPAGIGAGSPVDIGMAFGHGARVAEGLPATVPGGIGILPAMDWNLPGTTITNGPGIINSFGGYLQGKDLAVQAASIAEVGKKTFEFMLPAAGKAALAGGLFQLGIDACRGIFKREKSAGLFIRSMIKKGKLEGKMAKSIMFGDRARFDQLTRYKEMLDEGSLTAADLSPETIKRLAATAIAHDADLRAIQSLLPEEARNFTASDQAYFARVKQAMETSVKLIKEGLPEGEWGDFFEDYLTGYMNQRNATNYLKMMGLRAGATAVKWSFVGGLAALFKGLDNFNVVKHWFGRVKESAVAGATFAADAVSKTAHAVTSTVTSGLQELGMSVSNVVNTNLATSTAGAGAAVAGGGAVVPPPDFASLGKSVMPAPAIPPDFASLGRDR